jgi:hypothetical protein
MSPEIPATNTLLERIHEIREQIVDAAPHVAPEERHLDDHTPAWRDGYQTAIADVLKVAENCLIRRSRGADLTH